MREDASFDRIVLARVTWQCDVTFGEDQSRIFKVDGDTSFSTLRRTVLKRLKKEKTAKCEVKNKWLNAG